MADNKRVVWILGAGFSRPLGGPLLSGLLLPDCFAALEACYPKEAHEKLFGPHCRLVHALYHAGSTNPDKATDERKVPIKGVPLQAIWSNPEEFLDYLDTAAGVEVDGKGISPACARLQPMVKKLVEKFPALSVSDEATFISNLSHSARRLLAAEASAFLKGFDPKREQWEPYRDWVNQLGSNDTLITFNYDTAVEHLLGFRADVVLPGKSFSPAADNPVPLYKLHGSANWLKEEDGVRQAKNDWFAALSAPDRQLVIAGPGPTKKNMVDGLLEDLWAKAEQAIKEADSVVFVGYRFPETDANARKRLLMALRGHLNLNAGPYPRLHVHTVLGPPDLDRASQVRLSHLLHVALKHGGRQELTELNEKVRGERLFQIHEHPLYAQDFFTVVTREQLFTERPLR